MWRGIFSRRDPLDTVEKVDRQRYYQNRRLICGLNLSPAFDQVEGALVLVEGCGHWMKLQVAGFETEPVPEIISQAAAEIAGIDDRPIEGLDDLKMDLAEIFSQVIWRLKAQAGKAADHVLAACIHDPGIWTADSSSRRYLDSYCAAEALAEKCGLTIIDSLPARDVAVGGNGYPLEPLPYWYLFANREERVSSIGRIVISADRQITCCYLPPSDGLDRELPNIRWATISSSSDQFLREEKLLAAEESAILEFVRAHQPAERSDNEGKSQETIELIATGKQRDSITPILASSFSNLKIRSSDDFGIDAFAIQSTLSAMLGISHLDQMPMNLPLLTGAESPRILGRITPGKPANWRRVLMNMSDYRPPAMKLRDAI